MRMTQGFLNTHESRFFLKEFVLEKWTWFFNQEKWAHLLEDAYEIVTFVENIFWTEVKSIYGKFSRKKSLF